MSYVTRDSSGNISGVFANRQFDGQEYAEGAELWTPPSGNPKSVTRFQAKAALLGAGLLAQVDAYMALPDTSMVTKLAWTETLHFERSSPTVARLTTLLGLTSTQVDNLFLTASQIEA